MKTKLTLAVVAALATGLIAAGCGEDDGDGESGEALTKQEFVAQANAICKQGNAEIGAEGEQVRPGTPEFDAFVVDTLVPNVEGQIADIRVLGIPEDDSDQVNAMLDEADAGIAEIEADPSLLTEGPDPLEPVYEDLNAYGLTECAD